MKSDHSFGLSVLGILILVLSGGCAGSSSQVAPPPEKSTLTFFRPSYLGGAIQLKIWDKERYVGALNAGSYIPYEVEPGQHLFLIHADRWHYLKAELAEGKKYYVVVRVEPGTWMPKITIDTVRKIDLLPEELVQSWRRTLTRDEHVQEQSIEPASPEYRELLGAIAEFDEASNNVLILDKEDFR